MRILVTVVARPKHAVAGLARHGRARHLMYIPGLPAITLGKDWAATIIAAIQMERVRYGVTQLIPENAGNIVIHR
jgi:hypothetical protein